MFVLFVVQNHGFFLSHFQPPGFWSIKREREKEKGWQPSFISGEFGKQLIQPRARHNAEEVWNILIIHCFSPLLSVFSFRPPFCPRAIMWAVIVAGRADWARSPNGSRLWRRGGALRALFVVIGEMRSRVQGTVRESADYCRVELSVMHAAMQVSACGTRIPAGQSLPISRDRREPI